METKTIGNVSCHESDGVLYLNLTELAKGLGYVSKRAYKDGVYEYINYDRLNRYLKQIDLPECDRDSTYIPATALNILALHTYKPQYKEFADNLRKALEEQGYKCEPDIIEDADNAALKVFTNSEFGSIRAVNVDGDYWFVGRDIALALGYGNGNVNSAAIVHALDDHVDEEDKMMVSQDFLILRDPNGHVKRSRLSNYKITIINESGLYALMLRSKLPSAHKFKRWVTSEVLPSISKHGAYMTDEVLDKAQRDPDSIDRLVKDLLAERKKTEALTVALNSANTELSVVKNKLEVTKDKLHTTRQNSRALKQINYLLCEKPMAVDYRRMLNRIILSVTSYSLHMPLPLVWNTFYNAISDKFGIDVKERRVERGTQHMVECIDDNEWPKVFCYAIKWGKAHGISITMAVGEYLFG